MKYAAIKSCDIANGPGVRVSLFVSGCRHHCKDCFNPETWDFAYGQPFDEAVMEHILALMAPDYIRGITYLGGEPFEPENQPGLLALSRKIRAASSAAMHRGRRRPGPWPVTAGHKAYTMYPARAAIRSCRLRLPRKAMACTKPSLKCLIPKM